MITYTGNIDGLRPEQLVGFFEGWPEQPTPDLHMRVLKGSSHRVLAINPDGQVVGFATAISDGSLNAYISLLEVLPEYRRKGIGTALVQQLLRALGEMYSVALHCDSGVREFYEAIGMQPVGGMVLRNYSVVAADRKSVTPRVREDS